MKLTISGVAYYECFDPAASGMAADLGLPEPKRSKMGFGERFTYEGVTPEQVREVAEHLIGMGELWYNNTDSYDRTEKLRYRRLIAEGERLRGALER